MQIVGVFLFLCAIVSFVRLFALAHPAFEAVDNRRTYPELRPIIWRPLNALELGCAADSGTL
jgi:hypothetical protein